ncbi:hypothetical protein GC105_10560 [Alkalibaculum sp. M08DMB]|uniref:Uncharacterized protein n=1 Tax=Alkalibaculum sporogenes TaxID=2655001 RepID=A0A6A7K9M2_9FIRM|nr:Rha family transcriptional regulator [Alkalibaculum sporogenes]MPW26229.1 hypothetical protein [Alkalibaculum sporogenes]
MNELLIKDYGLTERKGVPVVSSRVVAEKFNKRHDHLLRDISRVTAPDSGVSKEFSSANFGESKYKDSTGRKLPEYLLTRDGFTILAMGFTGKKAMRFKESYINAFNQMANFIYSLHTAKLEHPAFTQAIMEAHEEPKHYHFSNEADMINRIVLGMSASKYRKENNIPKGKSIRPHLNGEQIKAIETLQRADIGLILAIPEFEQRKKVLIRYFDKVSVIRIPA